MKTQLSSALAFLLVALVGRLGGAQEAPNLYYASTYGTNDARVEALESEIASLRRQLGQSHSDEVCAPSCEATCCAAPPVDCCAAACDVCCCETCCCCCGPPVGIYTLVEATMFRYHRSDGNRVGNDPTAPKIGDHVDKHDFKVSPRYTLGYIAPSGMGMRARYWRYGHSDIPVENLGSFVGARTYNIDLEGFRRINFDGSVDLELSAGFRYNEFDEVLLDLGNGVAPEGGVGTLEGIRTNGFSGYGAIVGVEAHHGIRLGSVYGSLRASVLQGKAGRSNVGSGLEVLTHATHSQLEVGFGWEGTYNMNNGGMIFARAGTELQQWFNYSSAFAGGAVNSEDFWTGQSDVGFGGFTFGLGMIY